MRRYAFILPFAVLFALVLTRRVVRHVLAWRDAVPIRPPSEFMVITPASAPGGDAPAFDPANPQHVLHVFEDWSAYRTPSEIATTHRADGGGPWGNGGGAFQTLSTDDHDPWFGKKALAIDLQTRPARGQALGHGLTLTQGNPPRYLRAEHAQESLVIEWAWRFSGRGPYVGKIADWQPYPGTDRFNYQNGRDQLGAQFDNRCDNDPLCSKYFAKGGSQPRFAGLPPNATQHGGAIARGVNYGSGPVVTFYVQNRNYGTSPGRVAWGGDADSTSGINLVDDTWRRTILRLTLNANGVMGQGRFEEWLQKAGEPAVKVMEYVGDEGGFDAGLVKSRNAALGGNSWFTPASVLYLYDLTAVGPIFTGGNTTHLGYVRIWSEPRPTR